MKASLNKETSEQKKVEEADAMIRSILNRPVWDIITDSF